VSRGVILQELHATSENIIQLIPCVRAFYAFESSLFDGHHNHENDVTIIPCTMGICQGDPWGGVPPDFNTPSQFSTPFEGIRVLGVPLGTITFRSSFIKEALQEDVRHVNGWCSCGPWNFNSLFCVAPIVSFIMHFSIFHLHKVLYFLWLLPP
jgi:hypothetical protein